MSTITRVFLILALLGVIFDTAGAATPVFAQENDPEPVPDPGNGNGDGDTVIIPETGADDDPGLFSFWTILIILGVVIVVLLIALLARGSPRT